MFGSTLLDMAIGLVFIYLLLSLVCSAANELIEALLKNRAFDLERGIRELLTPTEDAKPGGIVERLYQHPLVNGLFKGSYKDFLVHTERTLAGRFIGRLNAPDLPSYIPARNFALALMDTVMPAASGSASTLSGAAGACARTLGPPGAPNPLAALRNELAAQLAAKQSGQSSPAAALVPEQTWRALLVLVDAAGDDVVRARENIEAWFNSSMDRVAGWYKRRAQWFIFFQALAFAAMLNVDSVGIARKLYTDKTVRDAIVATADRFAQDGKPEASVDRIVGLAALKLPIGWTDEADSPEVFELGRTFESGYAWDWLVDFLRRVPALLFNHFGGWLLTALAVSLGAPFWFDLLNKIIVVRSTVKPQEKSVDEKPKP
jgi:hypothetical protein